MKNKLNDFYEDIDPRDLPAYTLAETARYLRIAPATLRSWVRGRSYPRGDAIAFFEPLIKLPDPSVPQMSFWNLIEAHVLRALRTKHGVSLKDVRAALNIAESAFNINRLLLNPALSTNAGDLFLDQYGQLINLTKSQQLAMKKILEAYLKRVEWDTDESPLRFFPFIHHYIPRTNQHERLVIVIDPFISFGRPVIMTKNISTSVIVDRIDAGETVHDVADDYEIDPEDVEAAVIYERAA